MTDIFRGLTPVFWEGHQTSKPDENMVVKESIYDVIRQFVRKCPKLFSRQHKTVL